MAFSYTNNIADCGGYKTATGNYNCSAVTTGTIVTGLNNILAWNASVATSTPSTIGTISGGSIALTTTSGQTGTWFAIGT